MATQTVTYLFASIEGSAAMRQRLGGAYAGALAAQRRLIRAGLAAHGGEEADTRGEQLFQLQPGGLPTASAVAAAGAPGVAE